MFDAAFKLRPIAVDDLIRVGRANDGGYVLPRKLVADCSYLVSYGIRTDWSFERGVRRLNPRVVVHAYDHTLNASLLVEYFVKFNVKFVISLLKLRFSDAWKHLVDAFLLFDYKIFFSGKNIHFRKRVWYNNDRDSITIKETFENVKKGASVLLKMDVERSEYRLIHEIIVLSDNIIGIIVEFHDIDIISQKFNECIDVLKDKFYICHVHGNNYGDVIRGSALPDTLEIVFISRRFFVAPPQLSTLRYPIAGLDQPNNPDEPDFPIDFGAAPDPSRTASMPVG